MLRDSILFYYVQCKEYHCLFFLVGWNFFFSLVFRVVGGVLFLLVFYKNKLITVSLCDCLLSQKAYVSHTLEKFLGGGKK